MPSGEAHRLLVVDDDDRSREIVEEFRKDQGYVVATAASGEAGVEAAIRERPDLILLDVELPDISGHEVCRRIKSDANAWLKVCMPNFA